MKQRLCFVVMLVLGLSACDKSQPVALPADKQNLLGTWLAIQSKLDNDLLSDHTMFVFHKNNHVSYLRCINRKNGHLYYNFPDSRLVSISDTGFEIATDIYIMDWNKKFTINRLPYKNNGNWYLVINKITLRKLKSGERSGHETWKCDNDERNQVNRDVPF
jgi:hypothetical protein